jgi:REP element-mobilizing transposase RayT
MSQSLVKNLIHLVFSTKERVPVIQDDVRSSLHEYADGILCDLNSPPLLMNSVRDHIHVLFILHKTKSASDVVMEFKRGTSIWMKEQGPRYREFYWQAGYGAFSVSQSAVENVTKYIANQESHHARRTFKDEFRALCNRHEIDFDERYVWD